MYQQILNSLFRGNADQACAHILDVYARNGYCIVDYLYFANIVGKQLFSFHRPSSALNFRETLLSDYQKIAKENIYMAYQQAILDADVVLMDGIALQFFYFLATRKWLDNLNWTDFCPYFLAYLKNIPHDHSINIILYGTYPHLLEKTNRFLLGQWYTVIYAQDWYSSLNRWNVNLALQWKKNDINILLVARTTPEYPIQEIRTLANKDRIRENGLIVMNQWGTFDFRVGEQKRAPKFVRKMRLEWLWRLISDPKRNFKKVLSTLAIFPYIFSYLILKKK